MERDLLTTIKLFFTAIPGALSGDRWAQASLWMCVSRYWPFFIGLALVMCFGICSLVRGARARRDSGQK